MLRFCAALCLLSTALLGCAVGEPLEEEFHSRFEGVSAPGYNELNLAAGKATLYEVQVRSANACHPDIGSAAQRQACRDKVAPQVTYRAEGISCPQRAELESIRLGTLDDMLEPTSDYREGVTVRYIDERVGANTIWLMPLFPNNDQWAIPHPCDNLGSPYAVRDYLHARGTLSRACIQAGRDEYSAEPCWANDELEQLISQAHERGMKVILDVAFNHFGHNYLAYDYVDVDPVRERVRRGENLDGLWDFTGTFDPSLLHPRLLDDVGGLQDLASRNPVQQASLDALRARCPSLSGDALVRAFNAWRLAFDWEREGFSCDTTYLEFSAPGFYLGADRWNPASRPGDTFTNDWRDVKFLFHHEENRAHTWEFARQREYLFRILNYWVSRGVDGFRLDHTTDPHGGMDSNEWNYLLTKVDYYAWRRGQQRPLYLAEEFHEQMEMNKVVDIMTEGYVSDMAGRNRIKDTAHVERVVDNMGRFGGHTFVMTGLETHDEHRLLDGTGFDVWTGAGFWGIGAAQRSTPILVMGQEFGESWGLGFRRSDLLRSRFVGHPNYRDADALVNYYHAFLQARSAHENRALRASNYTFLRSRHTGQRDDRIFAQARWSDDGNVLFVFHNLWAMNASQSFYLEPWMVQAIHLQDHLRYRLVDAISGQQKGDCRTGSELAWDFYVSLPPHTRAQWLRLERCD